MRSFLPNPTQTFGSSLRPLSLLLRSLPPPSPLPSPLPPVDPVRGPPAGRAEGASSVAQSSYPGPLGTSPSSKGHHPLLVTVLLLPLSLPVSTVVLLHRSVRPPRLPHTSPRVVQVGTPVSFSSPLHRSEGKIHGPRSRVRPKWYLGPHRPRGTTTTTLRD